MPPDQPPEPPIPAHVAPAPKPPKIPRKSSKFESWQLLNPYTARHSSLASFGIVGFRPVTKREQSIGYSLSMGESVASPVRGFLAGGMQEQELRFVPKDSLSLSLSRYQWEGAVRLGPLEPAVRVGFTSLHLDIGHGVSFGMFSPRVGFGLWCKLSHTRIGVSTFTEYFWRWVGDDSAFVHGLTLEIAPDLPPLLTRPAR